jgi:hypothetical protein
MNIVDLDKFREESENREIEKKIQCYSQKICIALDAVEEILEDIEDSDVDWFEVTPEHRDKIEAISKASLFMGAWLGWAKIY